MGIYSKDLRVRAVAAVERGIARREVVETFSISYDAKTLASDVRREGKKDLSPGISTGRKKRHILATLQETRLLWSQLAENDDATLERHCQMWEHKTGVVGGSVATMSRAIPEKLGWTFKDGPLKKGSGST